MLMSCSLVRQKCMAFLENTRELKKTEQQKRKRETLLEEVDGLKAKKKRLQYAEKAEGVREFKVMSQRIAKSNAMRKAATTKLSEIALIEKSIEEKVAQSFEMNCPSFYVFLSVFCFVIVICNVCVRH